MFRVRPRTILSPPPAPPLSHLAHRFHSFTYTIYREEEHGTRMHTANHSSAHTHFANKLKSEKCLINNSTRRINYILINIHFFALAHFPYPYYMRRCEGDTLYLQYGSLKTHRSTARDEEMKLVEEVNKKLMR